MRKHLGILIPTLMLPIVAGAATDPLSTAIANAETVAYCELLRKPEAFARKIVRVRALYQTDFEQSTLTAPSCTTPIPMMWVSFEKSWESRTGWRLHRAVNGLKWGIQSDVVFVGEFRTGGSFGHMNMYPFAIAVYKVEAVKPSGSFRPFP